jgi:hypothetical protein
MQPYFVMGGQLITDKVNQLVRLRGPLIPSEIYKEIGTNILVASAILSELTSKKAVKLSNLKVGGTPVYYVSGQEEKLQNYSDKLQQKEKEAYEQIKEKKILNDRKLDPAIRVAIRQIKDFAKGVEVNNNGETHLFWKWYLTPDEEAEDSIKKQIGDISQPKPPKPQELHQTKPVEPVVNKQPRSINPVAQTFLKSEQSISVEEKPQQILAKQEPTPEPKKKIVQPKPSSDFVKSIDSFFTTHNIEVDSEITSKRTERELVVFLPSSVGKIKHYCLAKSKKKCTDADLSSALMQGHIRKLPVLFLIVGELSKKAQELLNQDVGAIVVKKLGE